MGKRGPASSAPGGYGNVTAKGYLRATHDGRLWMEHDWIWTQANGPIPDGFEVHHTNGDKLDNSIGNLVLLTHREHKRIHSGCELRDGIWWKPCGVCGEFKPVTADHWYLSREGWPQYGRCRACHIRIVQDDRRRRGGRGRNRLRP